MKRSRGNDERKDLRLQPGGGVKTVSALNETERQRNSSTEREDVAQAALMVGIRRVLELLEEATRTLRAMAPEVGHTRRARHNLPLGSTLNPSPQTDRINLCRRRGDWWIIRFGMQSVFAPDSLGLRYLVELLQRPWRPVHALELFAAVHRGAMGDVAPSDEVEGARREPPETTSSVFDRRALSEFRKRLADLENEIESAKRNNDLGRLEASMQERDWLLQEIARARKTARYCPEVERARQAVSKGIKRAIEKLISLSPGLGQHLQATVHCGIYCCYQPPPETAAWEVVVGHR